ncbi:MAG: high-potential iron-sulfur protein [Novosphingobium sp.]
MTPLALAAGRSIAAEPAACYDPAALPLSQKNRRRSLGYIDASADPKKHCGVCAFFAAGQGSCGTCQLLTGGPVNSGGVCNSFAPKAA